MTRISQCFLLMLIAVISFQCQKELSSGHTIPTGPNNNNQAAPVTATLQGNVLDETNRAAAGVTVTVGSQTVITGPDGYFRITDASLDKNASLVTATQAGYFKAYRVFRASEAVNQVVIKLIKKDLAGTVDANTGGEATLPNGAKISLPANGVALASGGPFSGTVKVYASYINPESREIGKVIPGSLAADDKNQQRVVLQSFGMLAVELESASGEKLQVAGNSAASLTVPIPSSVLAGAPAEISLWYVDEQSGIWKEQGTAKKSGNKYVGDVKHFSYWNCDMGLPSISFTAKLETAEGAPLRNANVIVRLVKSIPDSAGFGGYAHGYTDSLGLASGLLPANLNLVMDVMNECYEVIFSKNIGPFNQDTDLGTIVVPDTYSSITRVTGRLMSCNNTAVSQGYVSVHWNNFVYYTNADANGKFSIDIISCMGSQQPVIILGVDQANQQQSSVLTIPRVSPVTNAGDVIACGTSSAQFLNYTVDGTDYAINSATDSLFAGSQDSNGTFYTAIRGNQYLQGSSINFNFSGEAAAGTYPINGIYVNSFDSPKFTSPVKVVITSYPQNPGEFFEGSFSGSFTDFTTGATVHTIDCTFRVRKY